ncbi:uncharacterized protein [Henckelia pumila]|uniref:uncharacterized protein n=1 Tax=Henckelia pumila TaxID=405737 RepID=UPI003C6E19B9
MDHMQKDCPICGGSSSGFGSQATIQQLPQASSHGPSNLHPCVQGQVFAINLEQTRTESERMISGTFSSCGKPAYVSINTSASHSFISARFFKKFRLPCISLDVLLAVAIPMGHEVLDKSLVVGCTLGFEGHQLCAHLMVLAMDDFDCIIGIDLLTTYRATVDCYQRLVHFCPEDGDAW